MPTKTRTNYYDVLGVDPTATQDQIRAAYRRLAKEFHPDVNPDGAEQFRMATEAYQVLSDPEKRQKYDAGETDDDSDGLSVEDLDAYFSAVRPFVGDELLDVGFVLLQLEVDGKDLPTSLGTMFVGPDAAVFIDARARAGQMAGRVAPIEFHTLTGHPDLRSDAEGTVVRLHAEDDQPYTAYIIGAAPFLGSLQGAASQAYQRSGRATTSSARRGSGSERPAGSEMGAWRILRWILMTLFILGLIGKLINATDATEQSSGSTNGSGTTTTQPAAPDTGTDSGGGDAGTSDLGEDSWLDAYAALYEHSTDLGGEWSSPVPGAGDFTAVVVQADTGSLVTHVYVDGGWSQYGTITPDFTDGLEDPYFLAMDTTGQGSDDILVTFTADDGETYGTVVFNTGEMATFTDADGEYGFIAGLDGLTGELVAVDDYGQPWLTFEYLPGQATFEITEV